MKFWIVLFLILFTCVHFSIAAKVKKGLNKQSSGRKNSTNALTSTSTTTSRPLLPGIKSPCSCVDGQCGCCSGFILDQFNQKACLNITYEPEDFALTAMMSVNGRVLYKRTVSGNSNTQTPVKVGKNPPPMCFQPPRLDFIRLCVRFSNIYFASRNVHLCINMEANWDQLTLVNWSFDCIRMGASGVAVVGPEEGGGLPANPIDVVDQTDEDYDDSARNVPLSEKTDTTLTHCINMLILDESLKRVDPLKVDKTLIKIKKLTNGNVIIAYDEKKL